MKIFDRSILALPFFDDNHRALAAGIEAWVETHEQVRRDNAGASASEKGRLYTQLLGADGWLSHAITPPEGKTRPDLRTLCIIREALAYFDDLADFAFAIQGLGAAPIARRPCRNRPAAPISPRWRSKGKRALKATCSTASRPGFPTATSAISTRSSPAPVKARVVSA
jgi:hypothetical protein